ncbi:GNAT family N-acetyltransferase [Planctomicrobium sp. SH664]|uniref:GNAT family N-acetyltransferase n=1 Tax=Planctomicrobium sp. SH664 TaxID=3448125 RepID=UPI003F5B9C2F
MTESQSSQPVDVAAQIVVRPAIPDDADDVFDFLEQFVEARRILPRTLDELEQLVPTGFVAEVDGQIVGFAALEIYSKKLSELRSLCVHPGYQGRGIGKRLSQACVELARQRNIFEVMVITSSDEFFRVCGFDFTLPGEKKALFMQTRETP